MFATSAAHPWVACPAFKPGMFATSAAHPWVACPAFKPGMFATSAAHPWVACPAFKPGMFAANRWHAAMKQSGYDRHDIPPLPKMPRRPSPTSSRLRYEHWRVTRPLQGGAAWRPGRTRSTGRDDLLGDIIASISTPVSADGQTRTTAAPALPFDRRAAPPQRLPIPTRIALAVR